MELQHQWVSEKKEKSSDIDCSFKNTVSREVSSFGWVGHSERKQHFS